MTTANLTPASETPLDSARRKAWWRLLPLLFLCYVIAYVDRTNVSIAKLTMANTLPGFNNNVIGFAAGMFFIGYFLLEIPGTLIVEKRSARLWQSRRLKMLSDSNPFGTADFCGSSRDQAEHLQNDL